jgi:hypothetical protein
MGYEFGIVIGVVAIAITILLFLRQMNLLTEALNTVRIPCDPEGPLEELTRMCLKLGTIILSQARRPLEVCDAYRAHRGYFDYILNNDQTTLQSLTASLLETIQRFFTWGQLRSFDEKQGQVILFHRTTTLWKWATTGIASN